VYFIPWEKDEDQARFLIVVLGNSHAMHEAWCLSSPHTAANAPHGESFDASKATATLKCQVSRSAESRGVLAVFLGNPTRWNDSGSIHHCRDSAQAFNRERPTQSTEQHHIFDAPKYAALQHLAGKSKVNP
jgi:hypothetical protein